MIDNQTIKVNLKNVLKNSNKTTKQILKEANINPDLYFQYMSVKNRRIPAVWIGKIAQILNISTDKILKGK